ncbi:MAG: HigA family addiction module antitoxin [Rhodocyclaceae bacterium]|nr:HigA family addiction module antitoxin [Rhodocyclaceae bacterium]
MSIRIEDLHTIDFSDVVEAGAPEVDATTPGDLLRRDFMEPLGLSAHALAEALKVPTNRVTGILNGTRAVTADTALRLARALGTTPEFWLNAQAHYDMVRAQAALGDRLDEVRRLLAA